MSKLIQGIHHLSLNCRGEKEYEKTVQFYTDILGLGVKRSWIRQGKPACMLDTGDGLLEIFSDAEETLGQGVIRHVAFAVSNADRVVQAVREAGYEITKEPKDNVIAANPPLPIRVAFFVGPLGELVELFQER